MINKKIKEYFLSHNGLGDHITMIGAVNFLLQYYEVIYFLCRENNENNVKLLYENKCVNIVTFKGYNEFEECKQILENAKNIDNDVNLFISGYHKSYINSIITHDELINYKPSYKNYSTNYSFIEDFYKDINLDLSVYYEYFDIESSIISKKYYDEIKNFNIVFLHTKSSSNEIDLDHLIDEYKNDESTLIICANKNYYNREDNFKYDLVNNYINIPVPYYIDIIKNSEKIYVIDSCFSCIVLPLHKTNRLKASEVKIISR